MDEQWGDENTTVITGVTSEHSFNGGSGGNNDHQQQAFPPPPGQTLARMALRRCSWLIWLCFAFIISFLALVSAPIMVALPHALGQFGLMSDSEWARANCEIDCQVEFGLQSIH
jgi:hypothetical protein